MANAIAMSLSGQVKSATFTWHVNLPMLSPKVILQIGDTHLPWNVWTSWELESHCNNLLRFIKFQSSELFGSVCRCLEVHTFEARWAPPIWRCAQGNRMGEAILPGAVQNLIYKPTPVSPELARYSVHVSSLDDFSNPCWTAFFGCMTPETPAITMP